MLLYIISTLVTGGCEVDSVEGKTQGDPLAMLVYAVEITPLLSLINPSENYTEDQHISEEENNVKQTAFADDFAGCGKLHQLHTWWGKIEQFGPLLGYYPNALKSWLIVKSHCKTQADSIFADTKINITTEGRKYLGGYIGTSTSRDSYIKTLIHGWINQVENLTQIAYTEPQAAYSAFVAGFQHKLTYHIRTIPEMSNLLAPLDQVINDKFIPAITNGHHCSLEERILLSLQFILVECQLLFSPLSVIVNLATRNSHVNNYLAPSKNKMKNINLTRRFFFFIYFFFIETKYISQGHS